MNTSASTATFPPCLLCRGAQVLLSLGTSTKPLPVIQCVACGSLSHTLPSQPALDYSEDYHAYHSFRWLSPKTVLLAKKAWRVHRIAKATRGIWLDVGCGAGHVLHVTQQLGWRAYGFDIPNPAGRELQKSGIPVFFDRPTCAANLTGKCDCITCWHTLEHVPDPLPFLDYLLSLLAPGGTLSIETPESGLLLVEQKRHPERSLIQLATFPEHVCIPSTAFYEQWIREKGLTVKIAHAPHDGTFYELYFRRQSGSTANPDINNKAQAPAPIKQALACGASILMEPLSRWVCTRLSWHIVIQKR